MGTICQAECAQIVGLEFVTESGTFAKWLTTLNSFAIGSAFLKIERQSLWEQPAIKLLSLRAGLGGYQANG